MLRSMCGKDAGVKDSEFRVWVGRAVLCPPLLGAHGVTLPTKYTDALPRWGVDAETAEQR